MGEPVDDLIRGLELEEPSPAADEAILALARRWPEARRQARRLLLSALLLSGSLAALVAVFLLVPGDLLDPSGEGGGNVAEAAPLEAIRELRADLDQIREMAELISPELKTEQETLEARVRECLRDLELLEVRLEALTESSHHPSTVKEGVNL